MTFWKAFRLAWTNSSLWLSPYMLLLYGVVVFKLLTTERLLDYVLRAAPVLLGIYTAFILIGTGIGWLEYRRSRSCGDR